MQSSSSVDEDELEDLLATSKALHTAKRAQNIARRCILESLGILLVKQQKKRRTAWELHNSQAQSNTSF